MNTQAMVATPKLCKWTTLYSIWRTVDGITDCTRQMERVQMDHEHPSLRLYVTLHEEYSHAAYLSAMKCWSNRRLLSRFRSGCHGLHVDTGLWEGNVHLDRGDRLCLVCNSSQAVEDEQQFLFDCPAYAPLKVRSADLFQ